MSRASARSRGTPLSKLLKVRSFGTIGVIAIAAFYVAWPLYAGYEIRSSLDAGDAARLSSKVDFPSVRVSLRPAVAKQVEEIVAAQIKKAGSAGALISEQLKDTLMPRVVDGVLATLVTPEMLIRIHASGRTLKEALQGLVIERASASEGLGGLMIVSGDNADNGQRSGLEDVAASLGIDVGKALGGLTGAGAAREASAAKAAPEKASGPLPRYGVDNIKHVSVVGPLALSIGVARDPKARKPDVTAELGFVNGSWKLTGLVPGG